LVASPDNAGRYRPPGAFARGPALLEEAARGEVAASVTRREDREGGVTARALAASSMIPGRVFIEARS
jgi:hypothetical protein